MLVDVWSCWSLRFRYSAGLGRGSWLRCGRSGFRLSHKWWEGPRVSHIRVEVSRGVEGCTDGRPICGWPRRRDMRWWRFAEIVTFVSS